ncbi:MAG: dolichyl-phosphate mannose synthase [Eubacteriales bacterium]
MTDLHLIMPMAGAGSRFFKDGFVMPKPLIEIKGKPFFYWATQSIRKFVPLKSLTFVVLQEHIEEFDIQAKISEYFPEAKFQIIPRVLDGAVLTCMEGIKNIPDGDAIIFNDCDHLFYCNQFYNGIKEEHFGEIDGALLTFASNEDKYSYLAYNDKGYVEKTVEKVVISNDAICGAYYFKNKELFASSVAEYLEICEYSEYFVSGVYNVMAKNGLKIKGISVDSHLPFGTPDEYFVATESDAFGGLL